MFASVDILKATFRKSANNFTEIEKVVNEYTSNLEDINCGNATAVTSIQEYIKNGNCSTTLLATSVHHL